MVMLEKVNVEFAGCGLVDPFALQMEKCELSSNNSRSNCITKKSLLTTKIPHAQDCQPETIPEPSTVNIAGQEWDVIGFGLSPNRCSTFVAIEVSRSHIRCGEPITVYKCQSVGEVGCDQQTMLLWLGQVTGSVQETTDTERVDDDRRHRQKRFRIYMDRENINDVCAAGIGVVLETTQGRIRVTGSNRGAACPYVGGSLEQKLDRIEVMDQPDDE